LNLQNVLAAAYPDLFAAGIVYSGVPAGCFMSTANGINAWNSTCASGKVNGSPQTWASMVRNMYPGYNGPRPKMQVYHGGADTTLNGKLYTETIKQWCGVLGLDPNKPTASVKDAPAKGFTVQKWDGRLEGIMNPTAGHSMPMFQDNDMKWFGFR
jgi:acetylxylan esterase